MRRASVLLLLLPTVACGGDDGPAVVGTTIAGAEAVTVVATDFAFEPSTIEVAAGEPVNVTVRVDEGGHDLAVPDLGFRTPIADEGESAVATLQVDQPGTYQFICNVPGHAGQGMVGTLVVS